MTKSNNNDWWFAPLFRVAGYGLLVLAFLDIVEIFVPLRFIDPLWEFQMVGKLVERAPVPLLGVVLVFAAETNFQIFKFLSWACLVVGVLFLLLVPLGVTSSWRINQQNKLQISTQLAQQTAQIQQVKGQLSKATTANEIDDVLIRLNTRSRTPEINNPQQLKSQLLSEIAEAEQRVKAEAEANQASSKLLLVRNAVKWNIGSVVCGIVFLSIWRKTRRALKVSRQKGLY